MQNYYFIILRMNLLYFDNVDNASKVFILSNFELILLL